MIKIIAEFKVEFRNDLTIYVGRQMPTFIPFPGLLIEKP